MIPLKKEIILPLLYITLIIIPIAIIPVYEMISVTKSNNLSFDKIVTLSDFSYIEGGDGFDETVFDWINLREFYDKLPFGLRTANYFSEKKEKMGAYGLDITETILCIIDDGLHNQVWRYIEEYIGKEAAATIDYWFVEITRNSASNNYSLSYCHYWYNMYGKGVPPYNEARHNGAHVHESSIVYLIKSLVPRIPLLVIGLDQIIWDSTIPVEEKDDILSKVLIEIIDGDQTLSYREDIHKKPHVISISFELSNPSAYDDTIKALEEVVEKGIKVFAAAGNYGENKIVFPANLPYVYAINSVYDFDHPSNYLAGQKTDFSNYGKGLFGTAPGYNIETVVYKEDPSSLESGVIKVLVSGTSYSAPLAALTYAILREAYLKMSKCLSIEGIDFLDIADEILRASMENYPNNDLVPVPTINSDPSESYDIYNGYGCVDIYDAVNFLGYLSKYPLDSISGTYPGFTSVKINLRIKVILSIISEITSAIRKTGYKLFYRVYRTANGVTKVVEQGYLSLTDSGSYWDIWKLSIEIYGLPGEHYSIVINWYVENDALWNICFSDPIVFHLNFEGNGGITPF
ncbi:MAG: S8/S53 family peptidase [Candidatus Njordarchaeales archaeon]